MKADFGRTAGDYSRHRAGFPDTFFERLFSEGHVHQGDAALDPGTGTVAWDLTLPVCDVTALDRSAPLLAEAAELDRMQVGKCTRCARGSRTRIFLQRRSTW